MKYELFDYQRTAAEGVLRGLSRAKRDFEHGDRSAFALSAITGSGKTVIATAAIEATFYGSADLGVERDPTATFLWVTDDPALNNQTRSKMLLASDLLTAGQLQVLDNDFLNPELSPNFVYFLNIQKLRKNAGLTKGGINLRQHSFWDVIANTLTAGSTNLYLVLDEAHRGITPPKDRKTIVNRIIDGQHGSNPPIPIVWGISATIDRFEAAMEDVSGRAKYPAVEVDIEQVRASGLVKDLIGVDEPAEAGNFGTTLLREAVLAVLDYERRWAIYSEAENEPLVLPVLVIQVPNKASNNKLAELISTIESEWRDLGPHAIAHVFGEHEPIIVAGRNVKWVPPESVQGDTDIRVILAKEAISTGWDCPRAEVMYSERPAKDATHIAQIVGRMVRQPLAHRIATDDALNSVSCFLPNFNRKSLVSIKNELEGRGTSKDNRTGGSVERKPKVFERNPLVDADVFDFIESLASMPTPDVLASPLRRAKVLARLLTDDSVGTALLPGAGDALTTVLNSRLDGLHAEHHEEVTAKVADLEESKVLRRVFDPQGEEKAPSTRQIATHIADLDRDTRKVLKSVKEGAGSDYYQYRADKAPDTADLLDIRTEVAALLMVDGVVDGVEETATKWVKEQLTNHSVAIRNTTGSVRDKYRHVEEMTNEVEAVTIDLRDNLTAATISSKGDVLPTFAKHIYSDPNGEFPEDFNDWETEVIKTEIAHPSTVGWYRNPARSTPAALRIAYCKDDGRWTSVQPDFVVISRRDDGALAASIVDPHGDHFADARNKLRALASYAENHGSEFVRVDSISKTETGLRFLDLLKEPVRETVRAYTGAEVRALYEGSASTAYVSGKM